MDESELSRALRRATDDVTVPRDLVRRAERAGRERRARRRSVASALVVSAVVLVGGALVVTQGVGGSEGASSTSGGSASSAASGSDAAPTDADEPAAPESAAPVPAAPQAAAPEDGQDAGGDAPCDPPLLVDGVPARSGYATEVRAGGTVEITGPPIACARGRESARYTVVLAARGPEAPTVLAEVVPADDGSFSASVTVPPATGPGTVRLSVEGSAWEQRPCPDTADCLTLDYGADLDVLPPGAPAGGSP